MNTRPNSPSLEQQLDDERTAWERERTSVEEQRRLLAKERDDSGDGARGRAGRTGGGPRAGRAPPRETRRVAAEIRPRARGRATSARRASPSWSRTWPAARPPTKPTRSSWSTCGPSATRWPNGSPNWNNGRRAQTTARRRRNRPICSGGSSWRWKTSATSRRKTRSWKPSWRWRTANGAPVSRLAAAAGKR